MINILILLSLLLLIIIDTYSLVRYKALSLLTLTRLSAATSNTNKMDLSQMVNDAVNKHKNGKFEEAIDAYENVLPLLGKGKLTSNLHSNVGALYLQSGDYEKARFQFNNAIEALSENSMAHFNLAIILTTKFSEHKKALKHCKEALKLDPNNHKFIHLMGNILQNMGQNEEADRYFIKAEEMAIEQNPQQYDVEQDKIIRKDKNLNFLPIMKTRIGRTSINIDGIDYSINCISERPLLFQLPNFISVDNCEHIIARASHQLEKSFVMGGGSKDTIEPYRSSFNAWLSRDLILEKMLQRLEVITKIPISYLLQKTEELQVVKYENQGQFKLHHDSSNFHPRFFTLLLYLNDLPDDSGGQTYFPFTGVDRKFDYSIEDAISKGFTVYEEHKNSGTYIQPKKGDAILFFNYNINGEIDTSAVHAGLPLNSNTTDKWIANYWLDFDFDLLVDFKKI